jgi:hypothetical protein
MVYHCLPMRTLFIWASVVLLGASMAAPTQGFQTANGTEPTACAPAGASYTQTTLYFGLARPAGTISGREWKAFVRDEISSRFPQGFTIWEAHGQWRTADGKINR